MNPQKKATKQGWFVCLIIGFVCACLSALFLFIGFNQPKQENPAQVVGMILSQPAWICLALAAYLAARKMAKEGAGSLGVGGRVFAGLFAIAAILAGAFLLYEGYSDPQLGDPETNGKLKKFGFGTLLAGILGILYCVLFGRNPEAPDLDLD